MENLNHLLEVLKVLVIIKQLTEWIQSKKNKNR